MRRIGWAGVLVGVLVMGSACGSGEPAGTTAPPPAHQHSGSAAPAAPLRDGERFVDVSMKAAYSPAAPHGGTDDYRCFLVDPGITGTSFLTGSQFLPQNAGVVHHAIFFRITPEQAAEAERMDANTPGQGWTCFGNAGIAETAAWVASWAPGADETLLRPDIGYPMAAGSKLVMQVHYNLLVAKPGDTDRSGVRLRLTEKPGLTPLSTKLLPAPIELACAPVEKGPLCDRTAAVRDVSSRFGEDAGQRVEGLHRHCNGDRAPAASTETRCEYPVRGNATIYAMGGHMHLLGRSIKIELNPGKPGASTLLDVPAYNFDEQGIFPLAKPATVKPGDTLRVTCTHDVGLRRQLPQLRDQAPRYVVWGEGTSDEMCLGVVVLSSATA
ncbi:monooxygenase [Actinoplanes sp. NBRC 103695]|uniref:monooxygenase n=1 Tax=Actinoplanes sp. NBRC 103695 TaxID=3032202 RepID=UPI002556148B|nr:monooxygenase [Actinoplanes sp. NBRC 103695]